MSKRSALWWRRYRKSRAESYRRNHREYMARVKRHVQLFEALRWIEQENQTSLRYF